jgi:hypothetical protein
MTTAQIITDHLAEHKSSAVLRVRFSDYLLTQLPPNAILTALPEQLTLDQVPAHRHLTCQHYRICLTIASYLAWPSFTCRACPLANKPVNY